MLHLGDYQYEYKRDTYVAPTGNVRDPDDTAAVFGVDGTRYIVLREVPFDADLEQLLPAASAALRTRERICRLAAAAHPARPWP